MQNLHKYLRLLPAIALATAIAQAAPLKVVNWNIEWFPGHRPTASAEEADAHMKAAQAELKKIDPDIFVAVEVRDWAAFDELVKAVPGLTTHVVSNFVDPESGEIRPQQIGIASKLPCRAAAWERWQANVPNISRGFSYAALEQKDGGLLMIYGNHLKSNRGNPKDVAAMREDQAKQLIANREVVEKAFANRKIAGWILTGDFNTNHDNQFPGDNTIKVLTDAGYRNTWADTPKAQRLTWRSYPESRYEPTTFDYFFTRGLGDLKAEMIDSAAEVSDHAPISISIPQD